MMYNNITVRASIILVFCLLLSTEISMQELQKYKWNRRLLIISGSSNGANSLQSIINNYKCEMALRNMNVLILGSTQSTDTMFTYDQNNGEPIQHRTDILSQSSAEKIKQNLVGKYTNLAEIKSWSMLVGYDGYRKNTYRSTDVNDFVSGMLKQIDRMPMRRQEIKRQQNLGINCNQPAPMTSGA